MSEIGKVTVSIAAKIDQLERDLAKARAELRSLGPAAQEGASAAQVGLGNLTRGLSQAGQAADATKRGVESLGQAARQQVESMGALGRAGVGALEAIGAASAGALIGLAAIATGALAVAKALSDAGRYAQDVHLLSQQAGLGAAEFTKLAYAAKIAADVTGGELVGALRIFADKRDAALQGNTEAIAAFRRASIDFTKPASEGFAQLADHVANLADKNEKVAVSTDFLGRAGARFIPLLAEQGDGIRRLGDEAERFGSVIDERLTGKIDALGDSTDRVGTAVLGVEISILKLADSSGAIDVLTGTFNGLAEAIAAVGRGLSSDRFQQILAAAFPNAALAIKGIKAATSGPGGPLDTTDAIGGQSVGAGGQSSPAPDFTGIRALGKLDEGPQIDPVLRFERENEASLARQQREVAERGKAEREAEAEARSSRAEAKKDADEQLRIAEQTFKLKQETAELEANTVAGAAKTRLEQAERALDLEHLTADEKAKLYALAQQVDETEAARLQTTVALLQAERDQVANAKNLDAALRQAKLAHLDAEIASARTNLELMPSAATELSIKLAQAAGAARGIGDALADSLDKGFEEGIKGIAAGTGNLGNLLKRSLTSGLLDFAFGQFKQAGGIGGLLGLGGGGQAGGSSGLGSILSGIGSLFSGSGGGSSTGLIGSALSLFGGSGGGTTGALSGLSSLFGGGTTGGAGILGLFGGGGSAGAPSLLGSIGSGIAGLLGLGGGVAAGTGAASGGAIALGQVANLANLAELGVTGMSAAVTASAAGTGAAAAESAAAGAAGGLGGAATGGILAAVVFAILGVMRAFDLAKGNLEQRQASGRAMVDPVTYGLFGSLGLGLSDTKKISGILTGGISTVLGPLFAPRLPTIEGATGRSVGDTLRALGYGNAPDTAGGKVQVLHGGGGDVMIRSASQRPYDPLKLGDEGFPQVPLPESYKNLDTESSIRLSELSFQGIRNPTLYRGIQEDSTGAAPVRGVLNYAAGMGFSEEDAAIALKRYNLAAALKSGGTPTENPTIDEAILNLRRGEQNNLKRIREGNLSPADKDAAIAQEKSDFMVRVAAVIDGFTDLPPAVKAANVALYALNENGELQIEAMKRVTQSAVDLAKGLDLGGAARAAFQPGANAATFGRELQKNANEAAQQIIFDQLGHGKIGENFQSFTADIGGAAEAFRQGNTAKGDELIKQARADYLLATQGAGAYFDEIKKNSPALAAYVDELERQNDALETAGQASAIGAKGLAGSLKSVSEDELLKSAADDIGNIIAQRIAEKVGQAELFTAALGPAIEEAKQYVDDIIAGDQAAADRDFAEFQQKYQTGADAYRNILTTLGPGLSAIGGVLGLDGGNAGPAQIAGARNFSTVHLPSFDVGLERVPGAHGAPMAAIIHGGETIIGDNQFAVFGRMVQLHEATLSVLTDISRAVRSPTAGGNVDDVFVALRRGLDRVDRLSRAGGNYGNAGIG